MTAERSLPLLARWSTSLALVVVLHGAAYTALQTTHAIAPNRPDDPIMLDLAQEPVPPPPEPAAAPEPPPPEPEPPPPQVKPEVVIPEPPPPPPPPVRKVERPVKRDTQPVPTPVQTAQTTPAETPVQAAPAITPQQVSWQGRLAGYLARFKRYPVSAQRRNEQGVVLMRLLVARDGTVVSTAVVRGSGFEDLDQAAGEWVARASPVPAFTDDMAQARIEVTVPFRFSLR